MKLNEIRTILDEPIAKLVWANVNGTESKLVCPVAGTAALSAKVSGALDEVLGEFGDIEVTHAGVAGNGFSIELDSSDHKVYDAMRGVLEKGLMVEGFEYAAEVE